MIKCFQLSCITAVFILFSSYLQGNANGSVVVDRVVAVVNDEIITLSDLQREEAINKNNIGKKDDRLILEDMIDRKLQMAAAKRVGMDVTDKELADAITDIKKRNQMDDKQFETALAKEGLSLDQYKVELKEQITLSRMFNKYVRTGITVNEAEARAFYQNNINKYTLPQEFRVRQIFFSIPDKVNPEQLASIKEKAMKTYERAKKGEPFIDLVREVSEGVTVSQDGDLGFIQADQAIPEITAATRSLNPGEISQPFLGAGGYNIIRLEEVRTPVKPFEKVKDEIMNSLYQEKTENSYRTWLQTLRNDSHIENRL